MGSVPGERYRDFLFAPADLAEDVDLPLDLKKEILYLDAQLRVFDHWQLIGVPWNAPVKAVRAAYLEKVKVFHPDRHAGRRLGSYLVRIEHIFRALTDARDVLCDETRRTEYVRKTAPPEEFARMESRRLEEELRAEERRARLERSNPLLARARRVQELMQRGKQGMAEGRFAQASNDFLTVVGLDGRNVEARRLADDAKRRASAETSRARYEAALQARSSGDLAGALATLRQLIELEPGNSRYATTAALVALEARALDEARGLAEQAVRAGPRDAYALETLGAVLHAQGEAREARRALERALAIDPGRTTARALLKKLRWSFLP